MREVGRDLWAWLAEGAHFYVCGAISAWARTSSARWSTSSPRMARARTDQAVAFLADLKKYGRYQTDVY